jgi:iron(III) transport system substrate-binding protein
MKYSIIAATIVLASSAASAQNQSINVICGTNAPWCDLAAKTFASKTGTAVNSIRLPGGEALARIKAERDNPKTDIWWAGTGDPFLQAAEENLLEPYRPSVYPQLHA